MKHWVRSNWFRVLVAFAALPALLVGLTVFNGLVLANKEKPVTGSRQAISGEIVEPRHEVKVLSYNIAKGFAHQGGIRFADVHEVRERMDQIAELIRAERPDLIFLSEAVFQCHPCPINQVQYLSQHTQLRYWAFGENYNFGLPFYRIVGGNAILSVWPIESVANPSLAGRRPFYITKNNRRVLWCTVDILGKSTLLASVHNDSFDEDNRLRQIRQILDFAGERPTLLAGDFNACPKDEPIQRVRESGRFSGEFDGPFTFPAYHPHQTIDFIFAPKEWKLIEHRVIESDASDHLPVVSTFHLP